MTFNRLIWSHGIPRLKYYALHTTFLKHLSGRLTDMQRDQKPHDIDTGA